MSKGHLESLEIKELKETLGPPEHLVNPENRASVYVYYVSKIYKCNHFNLQKNAN